MHLNTIDTLAVRFEADAEALFRSLDTLEARLDALRAGSTQTLPAMQDIGLQLNITADEAISRALQGAGDTLKAAVLSHEAQFSSALQTAGQAMASALQGAVDRLSSSISITVPVTISGQRVATATAATLNQRAKTRGYVALS